MSRSGIALVMRFMIAPVIFITIGVIALFGWQLIEPFAAAFGAPASLGWGDPGDTVLRFAALAVAAMLLFVIVWIIYSPIRTDQRQQIRRR